MGFFLSFRPDPLSSSCGGLSNPAEPLSSEPAESPFSSIWERSSERTGLISSSLWDSSSERTGLISSSLWDSSSKRTGLISSSLWDSSSERTGLSSPPFLGRLSEGTASSETVFSSLLPVPVDFSNTGNRSLNFRLISIMTKSIAEHRRVAMISMFRSFLFSHIFVKLHSPPSYTGRKHIRIKSPVQASERAAPFEKAEHSFSSRTSAVIQAHKRTGI